MAATLQSRTLSIPIQCPPGRVYEFASNPENLPQWAAGLCKSVRKTESGWIVETPQGPMGVRFVEKNPFGVLDHYVNVAPDVEVYVPMRVLANGSGSELVFTLFRQPDMSDADFARDAESVERDLGTLKCLMEAA